MTDWITIRADYERALQQLRDRDDEIMRLREEIRTLKERLGPDDRQVRDE